MRKGKVYFLLILWVFLNSVLLMVGCSLPLDKTDGPSQTERQRFTTHRETADGAQVSLSGFTDGYQPGDIASFDVTIDNGTGEIWEGRYCLELLAPDSHKVLAILEQRPFTLEPGVGFSEVITVQLPTALQTGVYGLSFPVRKTEHAMVDVVDIHIGEAVKPRRASTQHDMDAALAACPPVDGPDKMVSLAKADLAQRLGIGLDAIGVAGIEPTEFPDASLGVPEPGKVYAQVITPGQIITLSVEGRLYRYHASDDRIIAVLKQDGTNEHE